MQVSGVKRPFAWLINHRLAGLWREFGNDVVTRLASHQNAAHRTGLANKGFTATGAFGGQAIAEVITVAFRV
jgi:hypothetical protein